MANFGKRALEERILEELEPKVGPKQGLFIKRML